MTLGASGCGVRSPFWDDNADGAVTPGADVRIPPFDASTVGAYSVQRGTAAFVNACDLPGSQSSMSSTDDSVTRVMLPFEFMIYDQRSSNAWVSSNGTFGFGMQTANYSNTCLPANAAVFSGPTIFAFWDDLYTRGRGVCTATRGTFGARQYVITWDDMQFCCGQMPDVHYSVTLLLTEGTQVIEMLYQHRSDSPRIRGNDATIGLQSAGARSSVMFSCSTESVSNGTLLRFVPMP